MISKLRGIVDSIFLDRIILDISGWGMEILCSSRTIAKLSLGQETTLLIEHLYRQENQILCGFLSLEDQLWFREILSVQGVGVKVALSLLSVMQPNNIAYAIINKEVALLTQADGVGKKVADRIISELKNSKLLQTTDHLISSPQTTTVENELIEALMSLGYERGEAKKAAQKAIASSGEDKPINYLLKTALGNLF